MITAILHNRRKELHMTQSELATLSEVSLPMIQKIESGSVNPTLAVVDKLASVLGLNLDIRTQPVDWDELVSLGLPLATSKNKKRHPSPLQLSRQLKLAVNELKNQSRQSREKDAVQALLLCLSLYAPTFYKKRIKNIETEKMIPKKLTGRIVKLVKISKSKIADYL